MAEAALRNIQLISGFQISLLLEFFLVFWSGNNCRGGADSFLLFFLPGSKLDGAQEFGVGEDMFSLSL